MQQSGQCCTSSGRVNVLPHILHVLVIVPGFCFGQSVGDAGFCPLRLIRLCNQSNNTVSLPGRWFVYHSNHGSSSQICPASLFPRVEAACEAHVLQRPGRVQLGPGDAVRILHLNYKVVSAQCAALRAVV